MNGIHDMGGMDGFGPIGREDHPSTDWELLTRVMVMLSVRQGTFSLDAFRYAIEQLDPAVYLATPYFERWLAALEYSLVEAGVLAPGEVDESLVQDWGTSSAWLQIQGAGPPPINRIEVPAEHPGEPRFRLGDSVTTRNLHPVGHTRLPRYARGRQGRINLIHKPETLPDTHAHRLGEHPQPVYNVRFDARELWGESAEPNQSVAIDLWECYLDPAGDA